MAAQTGILNASYFALYLSIDETDYKVAHSTNVSINVSQEMMGATTKDSNGWDESLPGKKSWNASGDFYYEQALASTHGINDIFDALTDGDKVTATFKLTNQQTGDYLYSGYAYIESIDINAGVEENISYSISLKGTGAITRAAYTP